MKRLLSALATITILMAVSATAGDFEDISMDELKSAIESNSATIIDVNGSKSYQSGHIPTAIDYMAVKNDLASKLPEDKDALIVAYCGSEKCGAYAKAAKAAKELGYTNVKHFSPGLKGWKESGAELAKVE